MAANGEVPLHLLVRRPSSEGVDCFMMPGTAYKHDQLVRIAQAERGWTPMVSGTDDAYRRIGVQWHYYNTMPAGMAAYPGTSSHGGTYEGVEMGAVDYGNWGQVGERVFFDLARRVGFIPGVFDGNGVPYEPWHVFDPSPWFVPEHIPARPADEEDEMLALQIHTASGIHLAILGPGIFRHLIGSDNAERVKNIVRYDDQWLKTDLNELPVLLRTYGCDLNIWDVRNGAFCVLDPLDGSVRPGNVWTADNAIRASVRGLANG